MLVPEEILRRVLNVLTYYSSISSISSVKHPQVSEFQLNMLGIGKQFNWLKRTGYPLATNCQL